VVCEDNGWAQSTPSTANLAGSIVERFSAFGIPVAELDSTDVRAIHELAEREVAATRASGPRALVLHTYRLCHHSKNDDNRPADEVERRWRLDPLTVHAPRLGRERVERIEAEVRDALDTVVRAARSAP
jgi:TPP-dependent pyruvate/acetoin dehydrogenase alpha subunit